jgi:hypothetical protein
MARREINVGADDLAQLGKIYEARPLGREVVAAARKIKGATVREWSEGGKDKFEVTATAKKAQKALAETFSKVRRLEAERGDVVAARREYVEVRNRAGKTVRVSPESEVEAGAVGLLQATSATFLPPQGYPRCWDSGHDYRNGRCWYCGELDGQS